MVSIRKFEPKDYKEVYALWQETGISLGVSDEYPEVIRFYTKNSGTFLVGCDKKTGEIMGVCMGGFDGRRGYIHHLAVKNSHRSKGYGAMLMQEVMNALEERGVKKVHLFIEKRNSDVESFYKKSEWTKRDDIIVMSKAF